MTNNNSTLSIEDLTEIITIQNYNNKFNKALFKKQLPNYSNRSVLFYENGFKLSECKNFYIKDDIKISSSYLNDSSDGFFEYLISDSYFKDKYKKIYTLLKGIANPHQMDLELKYSHSYLDTTTIKIDSASYSIQLEMENPNFCCLVDSKREVLSEFRRLFGKYLK